MKKSQLRKLIRKTIKENAIDRNLQRLNESELLTEKKIQYCARGDHGDVYNELCSGKCPCGTGCHCRTMSIMPQKFDRVVSENEGCNAPKRTITENVKLAHENGFTWVKESIRS